MSNITYCKIIVKDDFDNVLVIQKKVAKNEPKLWSLVGKKKKANETLDKCVHRIIKEELKTIGFDVNEFEIYEVNEEKTIVYTCILRERVSCHTSIVGWEWISKKDIENYNFVNEDKIILEKFWKI